MVAMVAGLSFTKKSERLQISFCINWAHELNKFVGEFRGLVKLFKSQRSDVPLQTNYEWLMFNFCLGEVLNRSWN